ncbi:MAG: enoyl-CoA hydratase/isomerase family protein [Hyphomonadaceae bacterium]|nr:enoyl-CoA hydratase/isomerase family protein [Hyphomonadaceae bacterium]
MIQLMQDGPTAMLTLSRPEKRNALTREFWQDMRDTLHQLQRDGRTRAVIITGAGDAAFCAGGDIASFQALKDEAERRAFQADTMATFSAIEQTPLVVIAAVNGLALGGGCELTLACDIVLAAENAVFAMPEAALGLTPGFGVLRGPEVIGRQWTKLMVFAGERVDAAKALEIGLVQIVTPPDGLMARAHEIAQRVAAGGALAQRYGKELINRGIDPSGFEHSTERLTVLQGSGEAAEGMAAFLQRRKASFRSGME